jgi:hypothetical protein
MQQLLAAHPHMQVGQTLPDSVQQQKLGPRNMALLPMHAGQQKQHALHMPK